MGGTSRCAMEVLDRTDDIALSIPSICNVQNTGDNYQGLLCCDMQGSRVKRKLRNGGVNRETPLERWIKPVNQVDYRYGGNGRR